MAQIAGGHTLEFVIQQVWDETTKLHFYNFPGNVDAAGPETNLENPKSTLM